MGVCRRLNTERAVAELDGIQVHLEDFLLRVISFDLHSGDHFAELTRNIYLTADLLVQISRQLHGNSRSALKLALYEIKRQRSHPLHVNTPVAVETMILSRYECVHYIGRYLLNR